MANVNSLLREASELRFGDMLSYNRKIEDIMSVIQNQSVIYEQVIAEYEDKKRVKIILP